MRERLGARPGAAQHRQPRPPARLAGAAGSSRRRRELEDVRLRALEVIGRAGLSMGGTQLAVGRAGGSHPDRGRALPRVRLRPADGGARGAGQRGRGAARVRRAAHAAARRARHDARRPRRSRSTSGCCGRSGRPVAGGARPADSGRRPRRRSRCPRSCATRAQGAAGRARARARQSSSSCGAGQRRAGGLRAGSCCWPATRGSARPAGRRGRPPRARRRARACSPGASPQETLVPYQPFVEALRHYLLNVAVRASCSATAREYGSELARLIPELRRRAPDLPPPTAGRARDRSLPAVRGRGRAADRDLGARRRSCSCSTTSSGPTARRCCCCATWRGPRTRPGC